MFAHEKTDMLAKLVVLFSTLLFLVLSSWGIYNHARQGAGRSGSSNWTSHFRDPLVQSLMNLNSVALMVTGFIAASNIEQVREFIIDRLFGSEWVWSLLIIVSTLIASGIIFSAFLAGLLLHFGDASARRGLYCKIGEQAAAPD